MFSNWFHELGLFIFAVGAHWQALATGGIVTAIVGVYEKKRSVSLSWQSYATIIGAFLLYSVFAAWQDEHHNAARVIEENSSIRGAAGACQADQKAIGSTLRDKESLLDTLQKTLVSSQGPQQQQAANIASCITNLAKMNPVIREKISVVPVTFGSESSTGQLNDPSNPPMAYLTELFIITNEPERTFNGNLKCGKDFTITRGPEIQPRDTVTTFMRGGSAPKMVAPNEYLITFESTGTEWNPSHPAFMTIQSKESGFGCTFAPRE